MLVAIEPSIKHRLGEPVSKMKNRHAMNREKAFEIFMLKDSMKRCMRPLSAVAVGKLFGVSEKVVRDIWKGRTWRTVTSRSNFKENEKIIPMIRQERNTHTFPWSEASSLDIDHNKQNPSTELMIPTKSMQVESI
jgi:hypothetical protein